MRARARVCVCVCCVCICVCAQRQSPGADIRGQLTRHINHGGMLRRVLDGLDTQLTYLMNSYVCLPMPWHVRAGVTQIVQNLHLPGLLYALVVRTTPAPRPCTPPPLRVRTWIAALVGAGSGAQSERSTVCACCPRPFRVRVRA